MPIRSPLHRPHPKQRTERLRGRKGVEQRKRRLMAEPLCRDCQAEGRVTAATVPDHIVPLAQGGTDTDDNIRCLCADHHAKRTAEQFGYRAPNRQIAADGWPVVEHVDRIVSQNPKLFGRLARYD